jgi:hypothetical protein
MLAVFFALSSLSVSHALGSSPQSKPVPSAPSDAELSAEEKNIIDKAVETIDKWNLLCEHGISVALENNTDIQYISQASDDLKNKSNVLKTATVNLKNKLAQYKYC